MWRSLVKPYVLCHRFSATDKFSCSGFHHLDHLFADVTFVNFTLFGHDPSPLAVGPAYSFASGERTARPDQVILKDLFFPFSLKNITKKRPFKDDLGGVPDASDHGEPSAISLLANSSTGDTLKIRQ
jgi:hypothetical protein